MKRARRAIAARRLMLGIIEINAADFPAGAADAGQQRSIGSQKLSTFDCVSMIRDGTGSSARAWRTLATGMNIGLHIRCYITKPLN